MRESNKDPTYHERTSGQFGQRHGGRRGEAVPRSGQLQHHCIHELGEGHRRSGVRSHPAVNTLALCRHTDLVDLGSRLETVALIVAAEQQQRLVHVVPGVLDLTEGTERSQELDSHQNSGY